MLFRSVEENKTLTWDHCREQFLGKMTPDISGFYFSHLPEKSIEIAIFLLKFEKILAVSMNDFINLTFCKTDKDSILWISPAKFWFECLLRRSLLTLILRASINYSIKTDNFEDCLFGDHIENRMIRDTKDAVVRFKIGRAHV